MNLWLKRVEGTLSLVLSSQLGPGGQLQVLGDTDDGWLQRMVGVGRVTGHLLSVDPFQATAF